MIFYYLALRGWFHWLKRELTYFFHYEFGWVHLIFQKALCVFVVDEVFAEGAEEGSVLSFGIAMHIFNDLQVMNIIEKNSAVCYFSLFVRNLLDYGISTYH